LEDSTSLFYRENVSKLRPLYQEYQNISSQSSSDIKQIENLSLQMKLAAANINYVCETRNCYGRMWRCADCLEMVIIGNQRSAEMDVFIANYYAKYGDKEKAKQLYRDIIVIYTGTAYKSYVKQAEFGLEDLKK
jgi:hypothetical protein